MFIFYCAHHITIVPFFQFSASVEDGLKTGQLSTNLQNEFIRDVCIAILNHTRYPTKAESECRYLNSLYKIIPAWEIEKSWIPQAPGYVVTLL